MENYNQVNTAYTDEKSYFEGNYFAYIGINIVVNLVSIVTLGIMYPWMVCWMQRWKARNTVVSGKRLVFEGTGGRLFGKYILWAFLTVITIGIYGFWRSVALKKWITKYTHFENDTENNSYFDGGVGSFIGFTFLTMLVRIIPLVGFAWADIIWLKWETNHSVIDSRRLKFEGSVGGLFGKYLLWGLLTIVTFSIFGLFVPVKYMRWVAARTFIDKTSAEYQNYTNAHQQYNFTNNVYSQNNYYAQPIPTIDPIPVQEPVFASPVVNEPDYTFGQTEVLSAPAIFESENNSQETQILSDPLLTETVPTEQPTHKFCTKCGKQLDANAKFCGFCGNQM